MLLYEAPSGIAIFSFDGAYLKNPVEVLIFPLLMLLSFIFVINDEFWII
jgi:hypothetical protein